MKLNLRSAREFYLRNLRRIKEEIVTTAGTAQCGATPKLVHAACAREVDIRAKIVWDSIQRAHNAVGSPITETLATDLKEEISHHIEKIVEELSDILSRELCLLKPPTCYLDLESIKREVSGKIGVKIDLYVDSITEEPAEPDSQQGKIGFLGELTSEEPNES